MGQWNDELRRRQQNDDVGFLGRPGRKMVHRQSLYLPLGVTVLGVVLIYVGPVPGLGFFLFIGGLMAAFVAFVMSWLGG